MYLALISYCIIIIIIKIMSVRPITQSEENLAYGAPWTGWLALMGATQGMITHLRLHNTTLNGSWMPNQVSRVTMPLFILAGAGAGVGIAYNFFGDAELRRLAASHEQDRIYRTATTKFE